MKTLHYLDPCLLANIVYRMRNCPKSYNMFVQYQDSRQNLLIHEKIRENYVVMMNYKNQS